jgi:hypothetical protein
MKREQSLFKAVLQGEKQKASESDMSLDRYDP